MEIEEAFTAYLKDEILTLKLFPEEIPQGTQPPAASYIKISDVKEYTHNGVSELESPVFQFSVFAFTKAAARTQANQIKAKLTDYVGTMGGIEVQHIKLLNEMSGLEKSPDGTVKIYTEDLEFEINFIKG